MKKEDGGTVVVRCNGCNYTYSTHAKGDLHCRRCHSGDVDRWRPTRRDR